MTAGKQGRQPATDPIQLLDEAEINLAKVIEAGWPVGVVFIPPSGVFYNVNGQSPPWVNRLLSMGAQGEVVVKGILAMLMSWPGVPVARVDMGITLSKLCGPYFYGPN